MPKPSAHKGKHGMRREKKSNIKKCQHGAWVSDANRGCEGGAPKTSENHEHRTCVCLFYPSVMQCDNNGKHSLKNGASPTLNLSKFSIENETFNEEKSLPRILGSAECSQHVHEHENKDENLKTTTKETIVSPTRDIRTNKCRRDSLQDEEAKKGLH